MATTSSTLITRVAVDDAGHIPDHRIVTANVAFERCLLLETTTKRSAVCAIRQSELFSNPAVGIDDYADLIVRVVTVSGIAIQVASGACAPPVSKIHDIFGM